MLISASIATASDNQKLIPEHPEKKVGEGSWLDWFLSIGNIFGSIKETINSLLQMRSEAYSKPTPIATATPSTLNCPPDKRILKPDASGLNLIETCMERATATSGAGQEKGVAMTGASDGLPASTATFTPTPAISGDVRYGTSNTPNAEEVSATSNIDDKGELMYDDGEKEGIESLGRSSNPKIGHLVHFTPPKDGFIINKVKLYGYRFGDGRDWYGLGKSFNLEIWNSDFKTIYNFSSDYDRYFDKGEENIKWVEISIPSIKVNNDFYIFLNTNSIDSPMAKSGIYVGIDKDNFSGRSFLAFSNNTIIKDWSEIKWSDNSKQPPSKYNWMIRVSSNK